MDAAIGIDPQPKMPMHHVQRKGEFTAIMRHAQPMPHAYPIENFNR